MNRLDSAKRAQVVSCLVEGNSIRATVRMTGVAKNTVVKLLCDLGRACSDYQDRAFRNLQSKRIGVERNPETRYSPAICMGARRAVITGNPDHKHISTSYVERQNLTMRMSMRRFTRLTNGFSKKVENLEAAVALHYMHYNFCRIHQTMRVTPAMEAGVSDHVWNLEEIIDLLA